MQAASLLWYRTPGPDWGQGDGDKFWQKLVVQDQPLQGSVVGNRNGKWVPTEAQ